MAAFNLPPPPQSNDLKSSSWQDWFYKLTKALATAIPGTVDSMIPNQVFDKRQTTVPLFFTATNQDQVLPNQVFAKPQQIFQPEFSASNIATVMTPNIFGPKQPVSHIELNAVTTSSILAGQIFGS